MKSPLQRVVRRLQQVLGREAESGLTDADLLQRYVHTRDEAAFESLVWRHGHMVLGVCRRVLGHEQDAEDAFQAVFLALARTAAGIKRGQSVAGWLYRVALRAAYRARRRAGWRSTYALAAPPAVDGDPAEEAAWRELRPILDEEVGRLPDRLRLPFVLCYLNGKTTAEAALELDCPKGTVLTRLASARQRLRARLVRRGVGLSAVLLTASLTNRAAVAAPAQLVRPTVRAALLFSTRAAPLTRIASPAVATLTQGVLRTMFFTKLKTGALVVVAVALVAAGTAYSARQIFADAPDDRPVRASAPGIERPAPAIPQAKTGPGRLLFYRVGHLTLIKPDGKEEKRVSQDRNKFMPGDSRLSPDGKRIAFLVQIDQEPARNRDPRRKVYVRALDEAEPGTDLDLETQMICWAPDGKHLAVANMTYGDDPKDIKFANWLVNITTKEKMALKLPEKQFVLDWSRDGKYFLTQQVDLGKDQPMGRLHLVSRDGTTDRALTDGKSPAFMGFLSPDGKKVLYQSFDPERKDKQRPMGLFVLEVETGKATRLQDQPLNGEIMGYCWSPDGRRIAYAWRNEKPGPGGQTESNLVVADADGQNTVTIATEQGDTPGLITIGSVDWR
jgi:RNA polymerase sigma factor (sigma-70 family)